MHMGYYSRGATSGPFPRSGENITQLRDGKHKPTPVRAQRPSGGATRGFNSGSAQLATLLLIRLCSQRHRSINEKITYPFVRGGRNSLIWRLHMFSASAIG